MLLEYGTSTRTGLKHEENQDSFIVLPQLGLFAVADGMGGNEGGKAASNTAVETIKQYVALAKDKVLDPKQLVNESIQAANYTIYKYSLSQPHFGGMGTTATVLYFVDDFVVLGHVGDSRCYRFRDSRLELLTTDHAQYSGSAAPKCRSQLTRAVGYESTLDIDIHVEELLLHDIFLICSDGLTSKLDVFNLETIITKNLNSFHKDKLEAASREMVCTAKLYGSDDDITATLIKIY